MEGLVQRWRGHGWSRLSHGIHTGGGRARITVTLVSVGPHKVAGLPLSGGAGAVFSAFKQTNGRPLRGLAWKERRSALRGLQ